MRFKYLAAVIVVAGFFVLASQAEVLRARAPIRIPDIPGFLTLKCDFHIHTVFSDGAVWPTVRAEEAWREGLDAIAITDHLEYQPHRDDIPTNHNRAFEIADQEGQALKLLVIRGSEITREMPPGHLNAIFLKTSAPLDTENWRDAVRTAADQGAFIFWNHPGWTGQQPDGLSRWYPEHSELLKQGTLHGMEVVNESEYYPEVHRWCLEHNLTMMSNSDIHAPINLVYDAAHGDHRPLTLVFATAATADAVKEALFAHRTAVLYQNLLAGREEFLRPIFDASVKVLSSSVTLHGTGTALVQISNGSDLDFELAGGLTSEDITVPRGIVLAAGKTVLFEVRGRSKEKSGRATFEIPYTVKNLKLTPDQGLQVKFQIHVEFVPEK